MNLKRVLSMVVVGLILGGAGWYWWNARRVELYGGVKPFMKRLVDLHGASAKELAKNAPELPLDFVSMEQLAQSAQDIFAVFAKDERFANSRFNPNAVELARRAIQFEQAWDDGRPDDAREAFRLLTAACNKCHAELSVESPPKLQSP
ncbi:MAG: hypothetical protein AABZ08_10755 [Planctomycetota bacterium]